MIRDSVKTQGNRFFLIKKSRFVKKYFQLSGVVNVGTPDERTVVIWSYSKADARSFRTPKEAARMSRFLWEQYGEKTVVVNYYGEVV